ncbi:TetR/AcrR family transcriptional regulator [Sanguibacter suaedae]|uniref:TetR/AcrR family transcriptional regulator n=1 Tax=Sanguibacter suaedae TaxID=2795737 RepID=UPI0027DDB33D|nr:TetR/AcrR family transcriptional regulator [Sanguibacter suaedae]
MPTTPEPPASSGLRERKKAARRDALIDASHELVREHGLDHVTVEMICDAVGVSSRTFFNYFDSKADAVLGIKPWALPADVADAFAAGGPTGRLLPDCGTLVEGILTDPPVDHARLAVVLELAGREPALVVRQMAAFEEHRLHIEALVARRTGAAAPGPREATLAAVVMLMTRAAFVHWDAAGCGSVPLDHLPAVVEELTGLVNDA